jgi:hypothetical protein
MIWDWWLSLSVEICEIAALVFVGVQVTRIYSLLSKAISVEMFVNLRQQRPVLGRTQ